MRQMNATTHLLVTLAVTAAAVLAAFVIPASAQAVTITLSGGDSANAIVGSGKEVGIVRQVGAFSTLQLDNSVDVEAHKGVVPGVTVHADDNIEPMIETIVEGDALVVRLRKGTSFRTHRRISVDVVFSTLTAARQRGSGDLHIASLSAPKFESTIAGSGDLHIDNAQLGTFAVSVAGSGDVKIAGHADDARFGVAGSGDIDATALVSRHVSVSISGSGAARVNATESIEAHVAGSGDVTYGGHPHDVSRRVSGSGSIEASN
jgi:hypothetical protein